MPPPPAVPEIDPVEASRRVRHGAVLLDVREPDEWTAGHAPAALHLPLGQLAPGRADLPRDRPVVVVCRVGARSARAVQALRAWGYDATNLAGGMQAWAAAGLDLARDDGGTPEVA